MSGTRSAQRPSCAPPVRSCLSAWPHRPTTGTFVEERLQDARRLRCPVVYVNLCGGNDELILDGQSFALDKDGAVIARLAGFAEQVHVLDLENAAPLELAGP